MPDDIDPVKDHDARLEYLERAEYEARHAEVRRGDKRLLILYLVLAACFILLAYRTEANDTNLREGLYDACRARAVSFENSNQLRLVFIDTVTSSQSGRPPEEKAVIIKQLRDGLLIPVESCGEDPRQ